MSMIKKSITVTDQQDAFIQAQIASGHYASDSEVIREALREKELRMAEIDSLRAKLIASEASGLSDRTPTDIRTAAAGAVAARHLAPETVTTAGVIGAGVQARLQIQAAHLVRPFARVLVHSRDPDNAARCAAELGATLE